MGRLTFTDKEMNEIRKYSPDFDCPVKAEEGDRTNQFCDKICDEFQNNCPFMKMGQRLKRYEDIIDDPEKLKLIDEFYLERCEEINRLNAELAEIRKKTIDKFVEIAMKQFTEFDIKHGYPTIADCKIMLRDIGERMKEVQDVN